MEELTEAIIQSRAEIYSIILVSLWLITLLINLTITAIFKASGKKKKSWGDFWGIWFLTAFVTAIILTFIIIYPEKLLLLINNIKELFQ